MAEPVRLRGEVGERRKTAASASSYWRGYKFYEITKDDGSVRVHFDRRLSDRRTSFSIAARVDAIVAHFKAALAELQEQSRADRAEVANLTLQLNEHMDEVASLTGTVEHLRATLSRHGFTHVEGAAEWKPPIGPNPSPLLDELDRLRAENLDYRDVIAKAARVIERKDADLIRYAAAGEVAGE